MIPYEHRAVHLLIDGHANTKRCGSCQITNYFRSAGLWHGGDWLRGTYQYGNEYNERHRRIYRYEDACQNRSHDYLLPGLLHTLGEADGGERLFELGCGNGSVAVALTNEGYDVTGVDPSGEGIEQARRACLALKLERGSCYDDLAAKYGRFPFVVSLEVVEHV